MAVSIMQEFDLSGRVALVTGASRGLGAGAAQALARAGAEVVLLARGRSELDRIVASVEATGGKARPVTLDVTDLAAVRETIAREPRLDVLVNNAGANIAEPFVDVAEESFDRIMALNVKAAFFVAQAVARKMLEESRRAERGGSIINLSSQFGHVGSAGRSVYCLAKHAVEGMTKAMALELARKGIRVNTIAPTYIETEMLLKVVDTPEKRAELARTVPIGRLGTVDDLAGAIVYLASDASRLVTGTHMIVDGGFTAR